MLNQLSSPTFFNINIFLADRWGEWPVTLVMGLIFVVLFLLLHYFFALNLKKGYNLLILLALCCLPFIFGFLYNTSRTVSADWSRLAKTPEENIIQSFCQMDDTQHMGGLYCALARYLDEITDAIPSGSRVKLAFNSGLTLYANYYLYGHYQLVNDYNQADYLLIFVANQKYALSEAGNLTLISEPAVSLGRWQVVASYHPEIIILKRL